MKKIFIGLFLFILPFTTLAESKMDSCMRVSREKQSPNYQKNIKIIKENMDTTFQLGKDITDISRKHIKNFGFKNFMKSNRNWLFPISIFLLLYLLWLKGKK